MAKRPSEADVGVSRKIKLSFSSLLDYSNTSSWYSRFCLIATWLSTMFCQYQMVYTLSGHKTSIQTVIYVTDDDWLSFLANAFTPSQVIQVVVKNSNYMNKFLEVEGDSPVVVIVCYSDGYSVYLDLTICFDYIRSYNQILI